MKLKQNDSLAVLIDFQDKFIPHIFESENTVKNTRIILEGLQALEIPLLVTEQNPDKLGMTFEPLRSVLQEYAPVSKLSFSCADSEEFMTALEKSGRKQIILTGIETHVCVLQTAEDLLEKGYQVYVPEDCVSSRTLPNKMNGVARIRQQGGIITCLESVLFEICGTAGNDRFRQVSKLVK